MNYRKLSGIAMTVLILGLSTVYFMVNRDEFHLITTVSINSLLMLSIINLGTSFVNGIQMKVLLNHYKINLSFMQWFGLIRISGFANLWVPFGGGASVKALYLKKYQNLPYSSFVAMSGVSNIIKIVISSFFALIMLSIAYQERVLIPFTAASVIFVITIIFLCFAHKIFRRYHFTSEAIVLLIDKWQDLRKNHKLLMKLIVIHAGILLLLTVAVYTAFRVFSLGISFKTSVVIAAFNVISNVIKLMPGNFGIKEAIIIGISSIDGFGINEGLHAAVLLRAIGIFWGLIFAPFFAFNLFGMKDTKLKLEEK